MVYIVVLVVLGVLDSVWLRLTATTFYRARLAHVFAEQFTAWPALLFYPLYALAVYVLVVNPALRARDSLLLVAVKGALLGLAAYGAYDFTNQATLKAWPLSVTLVDLAWGVCVTAASALIAVVAARAFH